MWNGVAEVSTTLDFIAGFVQRRELCIYFKCYSPVLKTVTWCVFSL